MVGTAHDAEPNFFCCIVGDAVNTLIVDLTERLELAALPIPPELQPTTYSDWTNLDDLRPMLAEAEALFCTPLKIGRAHV